MRFFQHRIALLCLPIAIAISGCTQPAPTEPAAAAAPAQTPAERGKVLVQVGGCHDCHTTKKAGGVVDMTNMLSGHPADIKITAAPPKMPAGNPWTIHTTDTLTVWTGAWGTTYAANITPDPDTGLKSSAWSEDNFLKSMKTGKHIGTGRDILPPMPWQMYAELSDEDLKAIWAYLMTVPPVKNEVPDPIQPAK